MFWFRHFPASFTDLNASTFHLWQIWFWIKMQLSHKLHETNFVHSCSGNFWGLLQRKYFIQTLLLHLVKVLEQIGHILPKSQSRKFNTHLPHCANRQCLCWTLFLLWYYILQVMLVCASYAQCSWFISKSSDAAEDLRHRAHFEVIIWSPLKYSIWPINL